MPEHPPAARRSRDRSYAATVLPGLAGAALMAVAGARTWATTRADAAGVPVEGSVDEGRDPTS